MQSIHKNLKELSGKKNPLDIIADSLVSKYELIFSKPFINIFTWNLCYLS